MNLKKAKRLRRRAIALTIGWPMTKYTEGNKNIKLVPGPAALDGKPTLKEVAITGTIRLVTECTRAFYHTLKRNAAR